jgi:hypothetical protein
MVHQRIRPGEEQVALRRLGEAGRLALDALTGIMCGAVPPDLLGRQDRDGGGAALLGVFGGLRLGELQRRRLPTSLLRRNRPLP